MMRLSLTSMLPASSALLLLVGCARDSSRMNNSDSHSGVGTDTANVTDAYASDGTLTVLSSVVQQGILRPVADSFGGREAIRVVFVPLPDSGALQSFRSIGDADLLVASASEIDRIFPDSPPWLMAFAERLADSSSLVINDSASRRATMPPPTAAAQRPARTVRGRRADSIRADSVRSQTARLAEERARADSARQLLLTMPESSKNRAVAERFVRYVLSEGRAILLHGGARVLPQLIVHGRDVPPGILLLVDSVLAPDTVSRSVPPQLLRP